ncbi:hypothetical protein BGW42_002221 [Actinomortierella wolfii]|nr:hypothetical protein BGW42_002221 [Actinomortierella wolfii]
MSRLWAIIAFATLSIAVFARAVSVVVHKRHVDVDYQQLSQSELQDSGAIVQPDLLENVGKNEQVNPEAVVVHVDELIPLPPNPREMLGAAPTARQRANNFYDIGVVGRRTGITIRENVKKDADGIDNIDDFWRDEDEESDSDDVTTEPPRDDDYHQDDDGYSYGDYQQQQQQHQYQSHNQRSSYASPQAMAQLQQQRQPQQARRWPQYQSVQRPRLQETIPEELINSTPSSRRLRREGSAQVNTHSTGTMSLSSSADIRDPAEAVELIARANQQPTVPPPSSSRFGGTGGYTPSRLGPYSATVADDSHGYQSPGLSAVRKRLVFTKDLTESESETEDPQHLASAAPPPQQGLTRPRNGSNASTIFGEQVLSPPFSFPAQPSQTASIAAGHSRQQYSASTSSQPVRKGVGTSSSSSKSNMATLDTALAQQRLAKQQAAASSSSKAFDLFSGFLHSDDDEYYDDHQQRYRFHPPSDYEEGGDGNDEEDGHVDDWEDEDEPQEAQVLPPPPFTTPPVRVPRDNISKAFMNTRTSATTASTKGKAAAAVAAPRRKRLAKASEDSEDHEDDDEDDEKEEEEGQEGLSSMPRGTTSAATKSQKGAARVPSLTVDLSDSVPVDDGDTVPQLPSDAQKKAPKKPAKKASSKDDTSTTKSKTTSASTAVSSRKDRSTKDRSSHHLPPGATILEVEKLQVAAPTVPSEENGSTGVRRSGRQRVHTLEYWKNERVVYETDKKTQVPVAMAIVRAASVEPTRQSRKRKRAGSAPAVARGGKKAIQDGKTARKQSHQKSTTSRKKIVPASEEDEDEDSDDDNSDAQDAGEEGFQQVGENLAETVQYGTDDIVLREIAITKSMYKFTEVQSGGYSFFPSFRDGGFMSSGIMKFPVGGVKPNKNSNASSMVFYVVRGKVKVTIYKTTFVLASGGSFHVPRGNQYKIENVARKESVLCFFQAKPNDESEQQLPQPQKRSGPTASAVQQRKSGAVASSGSTSSSKGKERASTSSSSTLLSGTTRPVSKPGTMPPPSLGGAPSSRTRSSASQSKA